MAAPFASYYAAVAERLVPFLRGRKIAVEQRFPGSPDVVYRRHEGRGADRRWIAIRNADDVVQWARRHAVAFHAHLRPEGPGCWFVLDIDSRQLDLEMARIAALHSLDALAEQGLGALAIFSGADGFHLMWQIPSLRGLGGRSVWELERSLVRAIALEVSSRLDDDERAAPLRAAVGNGKPLIATSSQDEANRAALLFDEHILKPNVNVRVPWSIHAGSGLVAVPLDRAALEHLDLDRMTPQLVMAEAATAAPEDPLPTNELHAMRRALTAWDRR